MMFLFVTIDIFGTTEFVLEDINLRLTAEVNA